jgi:hypothetical protein
MSPTVPFRGQNGTVGQSVLLEPAQLFGTHHEAYSTHERTRMSRLSGECRVKWPGETSDRQRTGSSGTLPS